MTQLMEIELDLLKKLIDICKKYDLNYYAACGTLLGTVRHKGFIPWDDDIDIFLFWSDYKRLMEIAPKECEYPYFFQCIYTEKDTMPSACRLRRSDTTGFTKWEYSNMGPNYDKGIFIDIIPLFNVPDAEEDKRVQKEKVIYYWEAIHGYDAIHQKMRGGIVNQQWESYIPTLESYAGTIDVSKIDIVKLKETYYEACAMFTKRTKEVGMTSSRCYFPKWMWETSWFDKYIELPFENIMLRCPSEYEKVLEKQYGDWRVPVKNGATHEMVAASCNTPWRDYDMTSIMF